MEKGPNNEQGGFWTRARELGGRAVDWFLDGLAKAYPEGTLPTAAETYHFGGAAGGGVPDMTEFEREMKAAQPPQPRNEQ